MSIYGAFYRRWLFPFWETRLHGRATPAYLDYLMRSQWFPREELQRRQDDGRKAIVEYAAREVPYYRRLFKQLGFSPSSCLDPDIWRHIPVLTKAQLQKHKQELIADSWSTRRIVSGHSGGSTGSPVEFHFNREHYDRRIAGWIRADGWGGYELGEKYWLLMIAVGSGVGERKKREVWKERLHNASKNWRVHTCTKMSPERMNWLVNDIRRYKPKAIFGYGSAVFTMARHMLKEGLSFEGCDGVIVGGEKTYGWQKETISKAFNTPVFERYGCQEFCNIAAECHEHDGMHINSDGLYVEVVDDQGAPVPHGQPGQIIVTSLDNVAMPFIRYNMGDIGSMQVEQCPCGRGMPKLKEILGREMDMLVTPEGNICAGIIAPHFMANFKHIQGYQFVQESVDRLVLRIVPDEGFDKSILPYMEHELRRYMGPTMKIEFEFSDTLERMLSGKYKMVVSKVRITP